MNRYWRIILITSVGLYLGACSARVRGDGTVAMEIPTTSQPATVTRSGSAPPDRQMHIPLATPTEVSVPTTLIPEKLNLPGVTAKLDLRTCALQITLETDTVGFAFDSAELTPAGRDIVANIAEVIAGTSRVAIVGHSSSEGQYRHNVALALARAEAARSVLVPRVAGGTFTVASRGPDDPVADNSTEEGRSANRRVVITADVKRRQCS